MDKEEFEAEAVAQYWRAESEETLTVADHRSISKQDTPI